jgi:hypothetical protein
MIVPDIEVDDLPCRAADRQHIAFETKTNMHFIRTMFD